MAKKNQNFEMWSGDTVAINVTVTSSAGVAQNITGATVKYHAAKKVSSTAAISKTSASAAGGITLTNASAGVFKVSFSAADTASLKGRYYHEAEVTDASSNVVTVMTGILTIHQDNIT